jgi:RNA polymerase sigma factor (TIGR02999 family)
VSELLPLVYEELRALAAAYFRREPPDHTLQPTALVHEAYLKLVNQTDAQWKDRAHFFAVAAQAIRRLLIDHSRRRRAAKRQAPNRVTVELAADTPYHADIDLLVLDDALKRLAELSERQARVVELRFFGGITVEEVAHVLGVSPNTVKGDWRVARVWLQQVLDESAVR